METLRFTVHATKTHLSRILKDVEAGKEVILVRGSTATGKSVDIARIVPINRECEQ
jgi:antitoxin (DNA-binding transcriptional repressor) of toxin-antitoxin stability system